MQTKTTFSEELKALLKQKGQICLSVIVPTHRLSPERRVDKLEVERAVNNAKEQLTYKYTESNIKPLIESLDELFQAIDFNHNAEGLGLYVSANIKLAVPFQFHVEEKVMVGDNFELRDLLYKDNYSDPYYVLLLTENKAKLFTGVWNELHEITNEHWPMEYEEEYSYNPPSQTTSYAGYSHVKGFEKDKSELEEIRFKSFFRNADKSLTRYLTGNIPLIILGVEKELSWFENVSANKNHIIAQFPGSYTHANSKQLADIAWPLMHAHLQHKRQQLVKEFEEKIGEGLGTVGIQEIWRAAKEGRGLKLLVEKDYRCPGFAEQEAYHLFLRPPQNAHRIIADAVDDIIETVLEKKGQVFFVDPGILKDFQRIALITRY